MAVVGVNEGTGEGDSVGSGVGSNVGAREGAKHWVDVVDEVNTKMVDVLVDIDEFAQLMVILLL